MFDFLSWIVGVRYWVFIFTSTSTCALMRMFNKSINKTKLYYSLKQEIMRIFGK